METDFNLLRKAFSIFPCLPLNALNVQKLEEATKTFVTTLSLNFKMIKRDIITKFKNIENEGAEPEQSWDFGR